MTFHFIGVSCKSSELEDVNTGVEHQFICTGGMMGNRVLAKVVAIYDTSEISYMPTLEFDITLREGATQPPLYRHARWVFKHVTHKYYWFSSCTRGCEMTNFNRDLIFGDDSIRTFELSFDFAREIVNAEALSVEVMHGDSECAACFEPKKLVRHSGCVHAVLCEVCLVKCVMSVNSLCSICRAPIGLIEGPRSLPFDQH